MLNPFPELLDFGLLAPFLLRLAAGLVFFNLGALKLSRERKQWLTSFEILCLHPARFWVSFIALTQIIGSLMLLAGTYTQIAAMYFGWLTLAELIIENNAPYILKRGLPFYLLLFAISASLIFSGAGLFALDIPL